MKTKIFFIIFFLALLSVSNSFSQESFAPKMDFPRNQIKDQIISTLLISLEKTEIPDKAAVGVPAYPQAKIIQINKGSKNCFNCIRLLAYDDCEKIVEFYKANLTNWLSGNFEDCYQFWQGPIWDAMQGKAPHVKISPANEIITKNFPQIKTEIHIWYVSNN